MKSITLGLLTAPLIPLALAQGNTAILSTVTATAIPSVSVPSSLNIVSTATAGGDPGLTVITLSNGVVATSGVYTAVTVVTLSGGTVVTSSIYPVATASPFSGVVVNGTTTIIYDGTSGAWSDGTGLLSTIYASTVTPSPPTFQPASTHTSGGSTTATSKGSSTRPAQETFTGGAAIGAANLGLGLLGVVGAVVGAGL